MRTVSFSSKPVHPLLEELFLTKPAVVAHVLNELVQQGVIIGPTALQLLRSCWVFPTMTLQCSLVQHETPFLDSHIRCGEGVSTVHLWVILSDIVTRFLRGNSLPGLDESTMGGVVMYVKGDEMKSLTPVNIYLDPLSKGPITYLRVRTFPFDSSLWDEGTTILKPLRSDTCHA